MVRNKAPTKFYITVPDSAIDLLEDMSFEDGAAYNEKLIPIARGDVQPDRNVPAEFITYDLWESMRACDKELADQVLEPTFTFMRAQTDKVRLSITELGHYLEYREKDVGKA
jgi:aristolochene synthase